MEQGYNLELNKYPIFDENYREVLNKKIVDEYYFREIGVETPARFKHHLNHTMDMIMPYYNQLYESELLEIDPLLSFRETEQLERKTDVDRSESAEGTNSYELDKTNKIIASSTTKQDKDGTFTSNGGETVLNTVDLTNTSNGTSSVTTIGTETNLNTVDLTNTSSGTSSVTTIGTETTDGDTTDTKTENKLSVTSDTPGGMLSIGDLKTHTWASSATMDEGETTNIGTNDKTVEKDETVTGTTGGTDKQTGTTNSELEIDNTVTGETSGTDKQTGTTDVEATRTDVTTQIENLTGSATDNRTDTGKDTLAGQKSDTKSGKINTVDEYIKTKFGVGGHQANLLKEYRSTFLNIDRMIVNELSALFMGVY